MENQNIIRIALITLGILLVPLTLQLTIGTGVDGQGFNWKLGDFIVIGVLIFVTGLGIDLAARKIINPRYRVFAVIVIVVIFLLVWAGMVHNAGERLLEQIIGSRESSNDLPSVIVDSFRDELIDRALARGPHPIEGFNAFMFLERFPGLEESDFDGVQSGGLEEEGVYAYADGELRWERTRSHSISTAERTILSKEYETLLKNLSGRLGMPVSNTEEVIVIVDAIDASIEENNLALNCERDIPREKIDDSVLNRERGTVTVYWWDENLQDNISLVLPYQPETDFAGCSESAQDFLRHIRDTIEIKQ